MTNLTKNHALVLPSASQFLPIPALSFEVEVNDILIIETNRGTEYARVTYLCTPFKPDKKKKSIICQKALRIATDEDKKQIVTLVQLNRKYHEIAQDLIAEMEISIKILKTELLFDLHHYIVHYTYRMESQQNQSHSKEKAFVHEFSSALAKKIDCKITTMESVDRAVAKVAGDMGICGNELCCIKFLTKYPVVSVKLAKEQGIPINMPKLCGQCGKLKCCLRFEKENYENQKLKLE